MAHPKRQHPDGAMWRSPAPHDGCIELFFGMYLCSAKGADGERRPVGRADSLDDVLDHAECVLGIARASWIRVVRA